MVEIIVALVGTATSGATDAAALRATAAISPILMVASEAITLDAAVQRAKNAQPSRQSYKSDNQALAFSSHFRCLIAITS